MGWNSLRTVTRIHAVKSYVAFQFLAMSFFFFYLFFYLFIIIIIFQLYWDVTVSFNMLVGPEYLVVDLKYPSWNYQLTWSNLYLSQSVECSHFYLIYVPQANCNHFEFQSLAQTSPSVILFLSSLNI